MAVNGISSYSNLIRTCVFGEVWIVTADSERERGEKKREEKKKHTPHTPRYGILRTHLL
jgi:hypothetical protein